MSFWNSLSNFHGTKSQNAETLQKENVLFAEIKTKELTFISRKIRQSQIVCMVTNVHATQSAFTCSESAIETPEEGVK